MDAGSSGPDAAGGGLPDAASPPACAFGLPQYTSGHGSLTWYELLGPGVNCAFEVVAYGGNAPNAVAHVATGNGEYFGAMNTADYDQAAACGACVEVTRDGSRKVTVTIVDQCPVATNPKCTAGHIDLSKKAFEQVGDLSEGYLGTGNGGAAGVVSWRYVPCPTSGNVSLRLKEPTNVWWNQLLVQGHRTPIAKVEVQVGGAWSATERLDYNYWQINASLSASVWPLPVRVTDVQGAQVAGQVALNVAGDQLTSEQFPVCE
ncbi:MAG: expansin EXLX1 family cellulose-binding protein [Myxococcales bacterium]